MDLLILGLVSLALAALVSFLRTRVSGALRAAPQKRPSVSLESAPFDEKKQNKSTSGGLEEDRVPGGMSSLLASSS